MDQPTNIVSYRGTTSRLKRNNSFQTQLHIEQKLHIKLCQVVYILQKVFQFAEKHPKFTGGGEVKKVNGFTGSASAFTVSITICSHIVKDSLRIEHKTGGSWLFARSGTFYKTLQIVPL
jgi:hypothetical protein